MYVSKAKNLKVGKPKQRAPEGLKGKMNRTETYKANKKPLESTGSPAVITGRGRE